MKPPPAALLVEEIATTRRSLRVAFVTETYPPEVNGVATTTEQFVTGLHRRGHEVQLVRPRQGGADGGDGGLRFHEVLMRGLPIPKYPHLRMGVPCKRALVKLWSTRRPDIVHVATEGPLGWSALQAARRLHIAVTSDFRTNFHAYSQHYGIGWLRWPIMAYLRRFHNQAACTMVPTELLRRDLAAAGFARLHVVPRGVDIERFAPAFRSAALRASWDAGDGDLVVGYVGRLAPEKNLGVLAAAWRAIRQAQPRARLVLVGEGPMRTELQGLCPEAVFAGVRKGDDLAAHYASMDLFLFPSQTETFGNVTTEALASGLPMVAFDHAAAGLLIRDGDNGLLAACGDAAGFVSRAAAFAADAARRRAVAVCARETALDLGWDAVVARFENHLMNACAAVELDRPGSLRSGPRTEAARA